MWRRRARLAVLRGDESDSVSVYSAEEYEQLTEVVGTEDRAHDRIQLATSEIHRLCDRLAVGDDVADDATHIYRQVIRTDIVNNYSIGTLTAAAVYTACRKHSEPRTMEDVDDAAHVRIEYSDGFKVQRTYPGSRFSMRPVQRAYRMIRDRFDRKYEPIERQQFVERYCAELELEQAVEEVARVAITRTGDEALAGLAPSKTAAGAIYYACDTLDHDVTQREIEAVTGCNVTTIGKTQKLIQESIEPSTE